MPTIPRKQTPDPRRKGRKRDRPQDHMYWTNAWRTSRLAFLKTNPECTGCGGPANVVDHVIPVRQGAEFFDVSNWQSLCTPCHASKSGREAHGG